MIYDILTAKISSVFKNLNLGDYGRVELSKRPELCDYQCNDIFAAAKANNMNPIELGQTIVTEINKSLDFSDCFNEVTFCPPGFININVSDKLIHSLLVTMFTSDKFGFIPPAVIKTFVLDYGGPNIAKPLHVGHFRTAVIGETMKNIISFCGHKVISDVHLGDYGLQIGQVMLGLKLEQPELSFFDEQKQDDFPAEAPFSIKDLERIYPMMSARCKSDEEVLKVARDMTLAFQKGQPGLVALWKHIVSVSVVDIKRLYARIGVSFDYWYGESDGAKYVPEVIEFMKNKNIVKRDDNALIIDVSKPTDTYTVPPLILENSNGSYGYAPTDLATIYQRVRDFNPDYILYFVDSRQWNHFNQVFRASYISELVRPDVTLEHIGYGTINGEDNKPFKTRSGDSVSLDLLINMVKEKVMTIREENKSMSEIDQMKLVNSILKFGDMQNSIEKNYIFDLEKFSSFNGKTGPYLLYSVVRIRKLLSEISNNNELQVRTYNDLERKLRLKLLDFNKEVMASFNERAPHFICEYAFELASLANAFYQANHLVSLEDETQKSSWSYLLKGTTDMIEMLLKLLVIEIPENM